MYDGDVRWLRDVSFGKDRIDNGADCPVVSMVGDPYGYIIGDGPYGGRSRSIDCDRLAAPSCDTPTLQRRMGR